MIFQGAGPDPLSPPLWIRTWTVLVLEIYVSNITYILLILFFDTHKQPDQLMLQALHQPFEMETSEGHY